MSDLQADIARTFPPDGSPEPELATLEKPQTLRPIKADLRKATKRLWRIVSDHFYRGDGRVWVYHSTLITNICKPMGRREAGHRELPSITAYWAIYLAVEAGQLKPVYLYPEIPYGSAHARPYSVCATDFDPSNLRAEKVLAYWTSDELRNRPDAPAATGILSLDQTTAPSSPADKRKANENEAIALLLDPRYKANISKIAKAIGVSRSTLRGWSRFRDALDRMKISAPRKGFRNYKTGGIDAADED